MTPHHAVDLFSQSQLVRGIVLTQLGIAAVVWPDVALPVSMAVAGALVAVGGVWDVCVGVASRRGFRAWPVLAGHGTACVAFGLLTILLQRAPQHAAMMLVAIWLVLYGLMTAGLAFALWPMRRTRQALLAVTLGFASLGGVSIALADMPEFVALYLGALFAVLLGALHLSAGVWLRRVAMPRFAPTTQSGWAPPPKPAGAPPLKSS